MMAEKEESRELPPLMEGEKEDQEEVREPQGEVKGASVSTTGKAKQPTSAVPVPEPDQHPTKLQPPTTWDQVDGRHAVATNRASPGHHSTAPRPIEGSCGSHRSRHLRRSLALRNWRGPPSHRRTPTPAHRRTPANWTKPTSTSRQQMSTSRLTSTSRRPSTHSRPMQNLHQQPYSKSLSTTTADQRWKERRLAMYPSTKSHLERMGEGSSTNPTL